MKPGQWLARFVKAKPASPKNPPCDKGILVFANTSEVIDASRLLQTQGIDIEVKGPPPNLATGCDMVIVFPLMKQAIVEQVLQAAMMRPERIIPAGNDLLDPVSLFQTVDLGDWLMVRAANMKITVEKASGIIVNISGGGCPDVPWLASLFTGKKLCDIPEPLSIGHTLCCFCLQKAYEEMKRVLPCG